MDFAGKDRISGALHIMLTLFLVKTDNPIANWERTVRSFITVPSILREVCYVPSIDDINDKTERIETDWYGVFFDYEHCQKDLTESLVTHLSKLDLDVYMAYHQIIKDNDQRISISPRFFRRYVTLQPNCLLPAYSRVLACTPILDGFVRNHDFDSI